MASLDFLRIAFIAAFYSYSAFCPAVALPVAPCRIVTNGSRLRQRWGISRSSGPRASLHRHALSILRATSDDGDTENDSGDSESDDGAMSEADLDQQKVALGNMLKTEGSEEPSNTKLSVLTTARKQRFEREIELLKQLDPDHPANNSELSDLQNQELVISELWSLWYGERGPMNMMKLRAVEENLVDPSLWPEAEKQYTALIHEHCRDEGGNLNLSNWVEPANRLATLLFLMGKFGESKQWCERILREKPWHIGALQGIVLVCMKMGDGESVRQYSSMGLPNTTPPMRNERKEWVQRSVKLAEKNLSRLEELTKESYGKPDGDLGGYTSQMEEEAEEDTSSWQ